MAKKNNEWWPGADSDKVLVPKVGQEQEFADALKSANAIAYGPLGWDGHAEMMASIMPLKDLGVIKSKYHKVTIKRVKRVIQNSFLSTIVSFGEWLTPEEAERRKVALTTLYGTKESL